MPARFQPPSEVTLLRSRTLTFVAGLALGLYAPQALADSRQQEMLETFQIYVIQKMGRHEEAFGLWLKLAQKGSRQGILNVAKMYLEGQGVEKDEAKALGWYLKGAEQGDADSMFQASRMLADGIGAPVDEARADTLLIEAAEAESREAQSALGRRLADAGKEDEARVLLEKARDAGDPDASMLLARIDAGAGNDRIETPPNVTQADIIRRMLDSMDEAANARNADAMLNALAEEASVAVSLPNLPQSGDEMSVEAYRALWRATFAEADEGYSFTRQGVKLVQAAEDVKVESLIVERFPREGAEPTELRLKETLLIRFSRGQPVIRSVELVAADPVVGN